jgi:hypothetical protein
VRSVISLWLSVARRRLEDTKAAKLSKEKRRLLVSLSTVPCTMISVKRILSILVKV